MRLRRALVAMLFLLVGCEADHQPKPLTGPVRVVWVPVPPPSAPNYVTRGSYPQLTGASGLTLVNSVLRRLIVKDSRENRGQYAGEDKRPGTTTVTYEKGAVSANSVVVSMMQPVTVESSTGGAGVQEYWIGGTWLLPSATEIKIEDLFAAPAATWPVLGELSRQALRTGQNQCTAASVDDPLTTVAWNEKETYGTFAVSPEGLRIGFNQYAVAPGACGSAEIVLPWSALEPRIGDVGRDVAAKAAA